MVIEASCLNHGWHGLKDYTERGCGLVCGCGCEGEGGVGLGVKDFC